MSGGKKKNSFGNFISTLILIISICVFVYAAYQLITIYLAYKTGVDEYKELNSYFSTEKVIHDSEDASEELAEVPEGTIPAIDAAETESEQMLSDAEELPSEEEEQIKRKILGDMENPVDFDTLCSINRDVIGWLEMEAISISYPMVRGEDNDYYLHRTFQRTDNFAGSIFMDFMNKKNFTDRNTIIYGHNMKNGSMFGILKNYRSSDVFDKSPYFWIYTPKYIYKYEIFSYAEVDKYSDAYQMSFSSDKDFLEYLYKRKDNSERRTDVEMTPGDRVVTLSTCTGNDATRFIVQGKRVEIYRSIPKAGGYE